MLLNHPQPSHRCGHGCTVAKTHPCDDPPKQDGESPKRQLVLCVVASACVVVIAPWLSCERCVSTVDVLLSNTPPRLNTRVVGFRRLEKHLSHRTPLIGTRALSSTPRVHLLRAATASSRFHVHIHVGSTEPCSRENFTFLGHTHWAIYLQH